MIALTSLFGSFEALPDRGSVPVRAIVTAVCCCIRAGQLSTFASALPLRLKGSAVFKLRMAQHVKVIRKFQLKSKVFGRQLRSAGFGQVGAMQLHWMRKSSTIIVAALLPAC